ncbi:hypothetical protein [Lishizhenia sp.]|uniref:hypothetical protein n=1 Tax=Lishizhenia sp. TaxID=2497594 RepID=UPI00299E65A2|nr:hypothetical protein [Lishizhenia sp.]MDX1446623.1 hypothetical protein [Lishizhenia sp.]
MTELSLTSLHLSTIEGQLQALDEIVARKLKGEQVNGKVFKETLESCLQTVKQSRVCLHKADKVFHATRVENSNLYISALRLQKKNEELENENKHLQNGLY